MKLESKSRSNFFNRTGLAIFTKFIPMVAEKDEIALIVQSDNAPGLKIGYLREKRGEHSTNTVTKHCVEIVHDKLRVDIARSSTMIGDIVA